MATGRGRERSLDDGFDVFTFIVLLLEGESSVILLE